MTSLPTTTARRDGAARPARPSRAQTERRPVVRFAAAVGHRRGVRARLRLIGVAVALVLVTLLLVAPAAARAATYTVDSCSNGSISGWAPFHWGAYSGWGNSCGPAGGAMGAAISVHPASTAGWTFTAPADTDIAGFRLTRTYALAANQAFGTGVVTTMTGPGQAYYDSRANLGGALSVGPESQAVYALRGQTTLTARLDCGGGGACTGNSALHVHSASIDLRDDAAPVLGSVSGSLLAAGALKGSRTIAYSAQDKGGGVRREQLVVDGAVVAERGQECSFARPLPCPLHVSGSLGVDTTRLADGEHEATLIVSDATLANRSTHGPVAFVVDNVPPPLSTSAPRITGTATLHADDGSWSGANLVLGRQWQRQEDGVWEDIAGATGPLYTPGAEDAGRRLRFRVRASNAEGTTDAFSAPTARLPELSVPTPTPTATPTATVSPVPTPTPVVVAPAPAPPQPPPAADLVTGTRLTVAFAASGRAVVTLRWGERRKVTGTLTRSDGRPLGGERVEITSRLRTTGAVAVPLGDVSTDSTGRFSFLPPAGASRTLTFTRGASTAALTVHVVPRITARFTRSGRIEGRVSGAPPGIAKRVQLQALRDGVWRTFATTRLKATGGGFSLRPRTRARRIRARVLAEPGWPFVTGTSGAARR